MRTPQFRGPLNFPEITLLLNGRVRLYLQLWLMLKVCGQHRRSGIFLHYESPRSLTDSYSFLLCPPLSPLLSVLNSVSKVRSQGPWSELRVVSFLRRRMEDKELVLNNLNG